MHRKHNALRDLTGDLLRQAGIFCTLEANLPGSTDRPADVLVACGLSPRHLALDISIVHTFASSQHHVEPSAGRAAADHEKAKVTKSRDACNTAGLDFTPVVAETTGVWGKKAEHFYNTLSQKIALRSGTPV